MSDQSVIIRRHVSCPEMSDRLFIKSGLLTTYYSVIVWNRVNDTEMSEHSLIIWNWTTTQKWATIRASFGSREIAGESFQTQAIYLKWATVCSSFEARATARDERPFGHDLEPVLPSRNYGPLLGPWLPLRKQRPFSHHLYLRLPLEISDRCLAFGARAIPPGREQSFRYWFLQNVNGDILILTNFDALRTLRSDFV